MLTPAELAHFHTEGYVVVKGSLDPVWDLEPVRQEYADVLDCLATEL